MAAIAFTGMDEVMGFRVAWAFGYSPGRPGFSSRRSSTLGISAPTARLPTPTSTLAPRWP